jgi:hypothetical protein
MPQPGPQDSDALARRADLRPLLYHSSPTYGQCAFCRAERLLPGRSPTGHDICRTTPASPPTWTATTADAKPNACAAPLRTLRAHRRSRADPQTPHTVGHAHQTAHHRASSCAGCSTSTTPPSTISNRPTSTPTSPREQLPAAPSETSSNGAPVPVSHARSKPDIAPPAPPPSPHHDSASN